MSDFTGVICVPQATGSWKLCASSHTAMECTVSFTFQRVLCKSCEIAEQEQESNNSLLLICTHNFLFAKTFCNSVLGPASQVSLVKGNAYLFHLPCMNTDNSSQKSNSICLNCKYFFTESIPIPRLLLDPPHLSNLKSSFSLTSKQFVLHRENE